MIDKKGKLFGIVNVIDLFIVLAVVVAVAFISNKFLNKTVVSADTPTFVVKFYTEEVADYVASQIKVGDKVEDEGKNLSLGTVTDVKTEKGFVYSPNSDGQIVKSYKEGYNSQEITIELKAQSFEHGFVLGGNKYTVGHSLTVRAGNAKIYLRISSIEAK